MPKIISLMALVFASECLFAQNLVPNSSFECGSTECGPTDVPVLFSQYACGWSSPNQATPDIFAVGMPSNCFSSQPNPGIFPPHIGSQSPKSGVRHAGIYVYSNYPAHQIQFTWREYLQVGLIAPLIPGHYYKVELSVSLADESAFATNNIGVAFSSQALNENTYGLVSLTPEVVQDEIITNSQSWVEIVKIFRATNAATHMVIGNFSYDHETSSIPLPLPNPLIPYAYYFVDDVSLQEIPCPSMQLATNEICIGDTATIFANTEYADFTYNDINWVAVNDLQTILGIGQIFEIHPSATTSYRALTGQCLTNLSDTVTVVVNDLPVVELGNDTTICIGAERILDAGPNHSSYTWQDHSSDRFFTVTTQGMFTIEVTNEHNCKSVDSILISLDSIPVVELGFDRTECTEFQPINATEGYPNYMWSTGSFESFIKPEVSGKYWVTIQNQCGEASDTIRVFSMKEILIPNVITPNGDDKNDKFVIDGLAPETPGRLEVYNRWGNQIYEDSAYKNSWPHSNRDLEVGIYYYILTYQTCKSYKGWIHVLK